MYKTCAVGPVCVVQALAATGKITTNVGGAAGGKVVLVSSEAGSITLRHASEGGGNYAHHASKAALNMVGKLLSLDLKERGMAVGVVHVRFCCLSLHVFLGPRFLEVYSDESSSPGSCAPT